MAQSNAEKLIDERKLLVERVASSRYVNRSTRLRDLLLYLTGRVLDDETCEIHEQEVGQKVFGRPADYDTSSDNIVRVHASMLRKRLDQYFSEEGGHELILIEIPKGNYAPVFRERGEPVPAIAVDAPVEEPRDRDWRLWVLGFLVFAFACSTALLAMRPVAATLTAAISRPTVKQFWAQVFRESSPTDIVFDDAAIGLYQELSGRSVALNEYYDRSYLRSLPDSDVASSVVLRRQSNFADISFAWKLLQIPGTVHSPPIVRFARDYSFRELKAKNAILLGNSRSNPWIEPFEPKLGIRWTFDKSAGVYDPVDTWGAVQNHPGEQRESYFSVALLPNLGGTGNVLIISGTGGSAVNTGADFLADEASLSDLRKRLPARQAFPPFEALIKVRGRSSAPRDATVVVCRTPRL
jgi:hypothetical protein